MTNPNQVTAADFHAGLSYAKRLGFKSITAAQYADFLERNAPIPLRSVLLIIDDLETPGIQSQYEDALQKYGFDATLAYIAGQRDEYEWKKLEALIAAGHFDLQAHGFLHNDYTYIYPTTPEETLLQEIFKPVDVIEAHSGKKPVAFIWPGGDYTKHAVDLASEAGYRLGFTVRNRGPVMFNWVPQGSDEKPMNYPLLVLPRAWSRDVLYSLDQAVTISAEAQAFAEVQREKEINWYGQYCKHGDFTP
jgi:peptidoglycan/xylan/chitin deacetylase (PgdA/CDA1 family)